MIFFSISHVIFFSASTDILQQHRTALERDLASLENEINFHLAATFDSEDRFRIVMTVSPSFSSLSPLSLLSLVSLVSLSSLTYALLSNSF